MIDLNRDAQARAYEVRLGHLKTVVSAPTMADAVQSARRRFALELPRLWDLIHSAPQQRFEVRPMAPSALSDTMPPPVQLPLPRLRCFMAIAQLKILPPELVDAQREMEQHARDYGLDFFPTIFELVDVRQLNAIAAYGGFPTRYPHWRFGMEYERLSKGYDYGLQKIYELVINNDPCYAYLLDSNSLTDHRMVIAHVYGHCDFFKMNEWFRHTNRHMIDEMANHGNRIRRYMDRFGRDTVEEFIDVCLSIEDLIDIHAPFIKRTDDLDRYDFPEHTADPDHEAARNGRFQAKNYMDSFINPPGVLRRQQELQRQRVLSEPHMATNLPSRDVLLFLLQEAPPSFVAARCVGDDSRRSLLFCPAGADQNHERRLGNLLAHHHHDPTWLVDRRCHCLR